MSAPYFLSSDPGPVIRLKLNDWVNIIADASKPTALSTSITVGTGQKTITVPADRAFGPGQSIRIARTSNPANVWMQGTVISYSGTSLVVQVSSTSGSGTYSDWTITLVGGVGPAGDDGWAPVFALAADGERRVLRVTDWTGGTGTKPPTGYVSESGVTSDISLAVDVRGPQGAKGDTGPANTLSIGTVQSGASADATITGTAPNQTLNLTLPKGDAGENGTDGWTPVFAVVADGDRRVWEITDWTGGTGTKPATGYVGSTGIVSDIADALDVRGPEGAKGDKGDKGDTGDLGPSGDDGWTPVFAVVADGERRVIEILDWSGGTGTKPATGYLGATGIVADIADALDVRGAPGSGSVSAVNNKDPDSSGNVDLGISDIPGLEDALDNAGQVKTVAGKGPDGSGNVALDKGDVGLENVDNVSAADLRDRSTHTGTQPASTVTGLATVATSGSYNDLSDKPNIPTIPGNATPSQAGLMSPTDKVKLDGIEAEATKNSTDAHLLNRANHTGTQPASTITGLATVATSGSYNDLDDKPDIPAAQVPADWNATSGVAQILNKPSAMSQGEAETGTATTPRLITAQVLKSAIDEHGGGDSYQTGDVITTARTLSAPDWLLTNGEAYLRSAYPDLAMLFPAMTKLANPSNLPTSTGNGCAFSSDGTYLCVAHGGSSRYITIYERSGDTFTKRPNPSTTPTGVAWGCAFSPDGTHLVVAHSSSPYITIYNRTGNNFSKISNPDNLPAGNGRDCAYSPDGTHLVVAHNSSPYITIYRRSGSTYIRLTPLATGNRPTGNAWGCAFSPDGTYLSVVHQTSPYITIYKRSGDTFTKLPDPTDLPASTGNGCAFSPDGTYLGVAHDKSPYITIYKRVGDTFTKLATPADLPASTGNGCAFSPDETHLVVAHNSNPFITIYTNVGGEDEATTFTTPNIFYPKTNTYIKT